MKQKAGSLKNVWFVFTIFLFSMVLSGSLFAASTDITIKGSTTVLPIAQVAAEEFMEANPDINISVQGGGSGVGIASLVDGTTDIADASRKIKSKEIDKAKAAGINPYQNIIAMDGIAVVVHPSNPIKEMTKDQIKTIYTGKISDWSDLGVKGGKIIVVSRDSSSGTFETFESLALDKEKVRADALTTASNQAVVQTVAQTPGAIGYAGIGYLSGKVKDVSIDGVKCTKQNIVKGRYSLSRPLFMYTNGAPVGNVKKLLDFIFSERGQKIVEEEGFVAVK